MSRRHSHHRTPYWGFVAVAAVIALALLSAVNVALMDTGLGNPLELLLGLALGIVSVALASTLLFIGGSVLAAIPAAALAVVGGTLLALWFLFSVSPGEIARSLLGSGPDLSFNIDALSFWSLSGLVLAVAGAAGLFAVVSAGSYLRLRGPSRFVLIICSAVLFLCATATVLRLADDGRDPFPNDGAIPASVDAPSLPGDPSAPGSYNVNTYSYGAGPNPRRPEFASDRDLESRTVDASRVLPEWRGLKQRMREQYWGFGIDQAPLNGLVWAPEGEGPFPLVLIVHGNHGMEDFSDTGYAYLGELLASRGFITVSVDQNYINGSWSGDFRGKEMAARAWLLLEHVALWQDWNASEGHPFASRIDMQNVALIGHSRGGEAVSIAKRFSTLPHFPDDATLRFDYDFDIHALVAIAQVDQRYQRRVELENVNFFTIHGSYDSDEPAYHGLRQMNRISFSGKGSYLKAGVYLHGANHGQFNTGWGRSDYSPPGAWRLNTAPIIPAEDQRQVAKTYISAFLEATLHDDPRYLPALRDPRRLAEYLPEQTVVAQYSDSSFRPVADFEEDINTRSASMPGAQISAENLVLWREEELRHRDERLQGSSAVVLGWRDAGATYGLSFADPLRIAGGESLTFTVSASLETLPSEGAEDAAADGSAKESAEAPTMPALGIEATLSDGSQVTLDVADHAQLVPPVRVQYLKNAARNKEAYNALWEPVLQYVEVPASAFSGQVDNRTGARITSLRFVLDPEAPGVLMLDDIGVIATPPQS